MVDSAEKIILGQVGFMQEAVNMIEDRISRLEPTQEEKNSITEQASAIKIFQIRSAKFFAGVLNFLVDECRNPDDSRYVFLLPNVRTLLDIYARFLHLMLNCPDEDSKALTCIAYQLFQNKTLGQESYEENLRIYSTYLATKKPDFPKRLEDLKYSWIQKHNLAFASKDELLTPENINRYSSYTNEVFGAKQTYNIYSHISELLHGNPYLYDGTAFNERFWVISMSISFAAFFMELIDRYILDRGQPRDFRDWLRYVEAQREEFAKVWKERRAR